MELYKGFFMLHEGDGQNVVRVLENPYFYQTLEPCKMSCNDKVEKISIYILVQSHTYKSKQLRIL